jgi:hypothetical protein
MFPKNPKSSVRERFEPTVGGWWQLRQFWAYFHDPATLITADEYNDVGII